MVVRRSSRCSPSARKALIKEKIVKGDVRVTVRDDTGDGPTQTVKVTFKK